MVVEGDVTLSPAVVFPITKDTGWQAIGDRRGDSRKRGRVKKNLLPCAAFCPDSKK
jgi:hypothetical protein